MPGSPGTSRIVPGGRSSGGAGSVMKAKVSDVSFTLDLPLIYLNFIICQYWQV